MATNRNSEHLRYRYGICLNDNCPKCKNKEVQQIAARKDFVCGECGKALRECPPPKKGINKLIIIIIAVIVIIGAAIGIFFGMSGIDNSDKKVVPGDSTAVRTDTVATSQKADADTVIVEKIDTIVKTDTVVVKETASASVNKNTESKTQNQEIAAPKQIKQDKPQSYSLPFGIYSGPMENGKPHGIGGEVKVTTSYELDLKKQSGETVTLSSGDVIVNTKFIKGTLRQGELRKADGSRKYIVI